jgi:hypothetical protein
MSFNNSELFLEPKVTQYGSHMVMTNVNKSTKKKLYSLDTRFRDDYEEYSKINPSYYTISIPQRINDVKSITVMNIEIPLTFYNISASLENNIFQVITDVSSKTIIIPDGEYTSDTLVTAVNNELTNVGYTGLRLSIVATNKYRFTANTGSYTISFAVKSYMATSGTSLNTDFNKYNIKSSLGWIMGFRNIQYNITSGSVQSNKITSEGFYDLYGPRYLYLVIDDFTQSNPNSFIVPSATSFLNNNIIAKISIDRAFYTFGKIYVANDSNYWLFSDKRTYSGKVDLQRFKVQLVNEYGLPINLNGLDFSFGLEIDYE